MRFSLETIAEGLETDTEDVHGSASDVLARHLPALLWKRIRKTEALLGLMATSCCLASKKRADLCAPLSRMKAAIRRKQFCLRRRALQVPDDPDPTTVNGSSATCSQPFTFNRQTGNASKNIRALEYSCDFMERMCQRVIGYLCVSQLEALTYDLAEQLANVVEDVGVLDYEIDTRQPMDDVMLTEIVATFIDMSLALPHMALEKFGRHFVHELKSKFDGDGAWLVLTAASSAVCPSAESQLEFSIWNVKDCYLWLRVNDERSYVIMHGLPGRKTKLPVCQSDLDFLLKDALTQSPSPDPAGAVMYIPEPDALRNQFENVYQGRWHCVRGEQGCFYVSSSKRLRHEARTCLDGLECVIWQW